MVNNSVVFKNDELYDQSQRAESVLDLILQEGVADDRRGAAGEVAVATERAARPVIDRDTGRTTSRVLFVTSDTDALIEDSAAQREYLALADYFDEIHVLVLVSHRGEQKTLRTADNVWTYSVHHKRWWRLPFVARDAAANQLVFNGGFRPDIVVGVDPYEAGLAALRIAKRYARPLQIHVKENFMKRSFLAVDRRNKWRRRIARYVLARTSSVRAATFAIQHMLEEEVGDIADLTTLPKFYNFTGYIENPPSFDIHDIYKGYVFIILAFGPLTADSYLHDTFTALHRTLHNPRIGLVVIGDGPAKKLFTEKAQLLGIERNVAFLPRVDDLLSYVKTADLLIATGTDKESETAVLRAAAGGLPIVAYETDVRNDLFEDGVSAFLCPPGDTVCMTEKFTQFLNSPAYRKEFARNSVQVAKDRLIENPEQYHRAYRDSIEVILETELPEQATVTNDAMAEATAPDTYTAAQQPEGDLNPATGRIVGDDGLSYPTPQSSAAESEPVTA